MYPLLEFLKAWAPFIILLAVWIFFMKRAGAGGGWKKTMDEQADIQRDIARHLDRIATALEKRP
ncbi:MAG: hypothetical protein HC844_09350 [Tabrizicola sp.]|nr:hypothetical protein [Tabrizicola sp.]